MAFHTGQPIDRIAEDSDRDFFMAPTEAKSYGLIDEVVTQRPKLEIVA